MQINLKIFIYKSELHETLSGYAILVQINLILNLKKLQSKFQEKHSNGKNMHRNKEIKTFFRDTLIFASLFIFSVQKNKYHIHKRPHHFWKLIKKGRCLGYINELTAMHSFLESSYQTPRPCYHSITNYGETEDASPSGIPNFRSCLLLSKFSTRRRRYGQKKQQPEFSHINFL